ncbi:hypothetical protein Cgig2_005926 [Carnegiea gigantea]|uniref:Uncharacterized protein n=1 Tax=Carnegiea gigantea TaxID=171969 RepID=A0A9Q1Q7L8_9CARY|nr:hypothetical protein Cgig2_005926 [Carnegiea gigantea]
MPRNSPEYRSSFWPKKTRDMSQIASLDWCQFVVDKLMTGVRHYKESTDTKGVHFDGPLFFLMYGKSEDLRKIRDEAREMFVLIYNDAAQKSQREAQGFNADVMKDVVVDLHSAHKANNDLCAPSLSPTVPLDELDDEADIPKDTLVFDANIIVKKEEHHEAMVLDHSMLSYSLGLGLSQSDSQSPVPQNTCVPDLSTAAVEEYNVIKDDNNGAPLRFPLRNTSQKKSKEGNKPASKKGEVRKQSIKIKKSTLQQQTTGLKLVEQNKGSPRAFDKKPKLTKEVLPEKHDEKHLGAVRTPEKLEDPNNLPLTCCSPYVIRLTKLNSELSQDKLTISEYIFDKAKIEPLLDGCGDKEATGVPMATLKPGEQLQMNVINIWSNILNDRERKRDLVTPSRFSMSWDQSFFFSREMMKRYQDFKVVMDKELERCPWIKIK